MNHYFRSGHYDLVSPDGQIISLRKINETVLEAVVRIQNISPFFVGYDIPHESVFFNLKSTLAQIGVNGIAQEIFLDPRKKAAEVRVRIEAIGSLAKKMLPLLDTGQYIGKLFAADERRRV